jgi:hypothetical protein
MSMYNSLGRSKIQLIHRFFVIPIHNSKQAKNALSVLKGLKCTNPKHPQKNLSFSSKKAKFRCLVI